MRRGWWSRASVALLLACGAPGFAIADTARPGPPPAEPFLRAISPDLLPRLERERFLMLPADGTTPGVVQGLVLFSRSYDLVWQLLTQMERQREYRSELSEFTNVERFANGGVDRQRISMLFVRLTYYLRYRVDPSAWRIEWSLDPNYENDLEQISGAWDLFELSGDRTVGRLESTVRLGPGMPRSLQDAMTRRNLPETLDNVRRWVDSGGKWRP